MKRALGLLAFATPCLAQTASIPPATPIGQTAQYQTSCSVPKNGGTCRFTIPPLQVTTPATPISLPVSLAGFSGAVSCSLAPGGQASLDQNGNLVLTGLVCTLKKASQ